MQVNFLYFIPIVAIAALVLIDQVARHRSFNKATGLFEQGKYQELLNYLDERYARLFYPRYNRLYLKYRTYDAMGDAKRAGETIEHLFAAKPSDSQLADLLIQAFDFYLRNKDFDRARTMLERIEKLDELAPAAPELRTLFSIVVDGDISHIEEMKAQLSSADKPTKQRLLYLLAKQYETMGNKDEANRCRKLMSEV